jgi:hypothetical protein
MKTKNSKKYTSCLQAREENNFYIFQLCNKRTEVSLRIPLQNCGLSALHFTDTVTTLRNMGKKENLSISLFSTPLLSTPLLSTPLLFTPLLSSPLHSYSIALTDQ